MRSFLFGFAIALAITASAVVIAATVDRSERFALNHSRAVGLGASGWTEIDCSAAAAYSAKLTVNSRILVQATADTVYFRMHSAGSGGDADANDGYLNEGEIIDLAVLADAPYLNCLGTTNSGKLRYIEGQ